MDESGVYMNFDLSNFDCSILDDNEFCNMGSFNDSMFYELKSKTVPEDRYLRF